MKHILFWSEYEPTMNYGKFINKKVKLSPFHILTLKAHEKLQNEVILFSYQDFETKLPKNVTLTHAGDIFPSKTAFSVLQNGHSIAHISDCVRLKYASQVMGVVLDMDAILLKKLPTEFGWFASMPAKKTGGFAPKWGKSHPPLTVHDNSWSGKDLAAFPIKVNKAMSRHIESLSHKIMHTLLDPPKKDSKSWNYVIWTLKDIMKKDSEFKVFPPISFCPVPAWLGSGKCYSIESPTRMNGKTTLFGHPLPKVQDIINESYVVQHFFESAFSKSRKVGNDFWMHLPSDCLLAKEAEHILGDKWRQVLLSET